MRLLFKLNEQRKYYSKKKEWLKMAASKNKLTFYSDGFSQPCRSVWLLLEATRTPYETCRIDIAKGESRSDKLLSVSPSGTVPAIKDNGRCLFESSAIMKYLVGRYHLPDHWYPSNLDKRAKIDEYLSWHTGNLRAGAAMYMFHKYIGKKMMGIVPNEKRIKEADRTLQKSLDLLETYFLKETQFISSNEISIADLQALCELTQFWLVDDKDPLKERPRLRRWKEDCLKILHPHFDKVHKVVYIGRDRGVFKSKL